MKSYVASHLKDMNRQVVFNLIAERGVTSKAEISKLTGISTPTVLKIISFLSQNGLILEKGEGESTVGRKPQLLTLNRDRIYSIAFFLEGEFLTMSVVDIIGSVVYKKTLRCQRNFSAIMDNICDNLVDELLSATQIDPEKIAGIGIALPGIYAPEKQTVTTAPLIGIYKPLYIGDKLSDLSEKYGLRVWVENDANAQCLGEFQVSNMGEDDDLIFISVGTGIGAGVILNGKLRRGPNHMCGEVGYSLFMDDYVSDISSPGWLESKVCYRMLEDRYGISLQTDLTIFPDKMIQVVLESIATPLAICINNLSAFLDCGSVRIGGVVVNLFGEPLIDAINHKLDKISNVPIRVAKQTSEDIGLVGMAGILTQRRIQEILTHDE